MPLQMGHSFFIHRLYNGVLTSVNASFIFAVEFERYRFRKAGTMKYRKKPVVIEAHRIGDDGWPDSIWEAVIRNEIILHMDQSPRYVLIKTLEGDMRGGDGDYIIRGVKGEFYPCKPDIFDATYEPA